MIAGIVLAAGASSRLGRPKQLLPVLGEPLIRYTLRRILKSLLDEVFVVVGHHATGVQEAIADLPVRVVGNPQADLGQSTSVIAGLNAVLDRCSSVDAAMFLLGDQPGVEPALIDALIAAWRAAPAGIIAPRYTNGIGNPVLFAQSIFSELTGLKGDAGARPIIQAHQIAGDLVLLDVAQPAPPDIDTEEDYSAFLASL